MAASPLLEKTLPLRNGWLELLLLDKETQYPEKTAASLIFFTWFVIK